MAHIVNLRHAPALRALDGKAEHGGRADRGPFRTASRWLSRRF